jgi:hypothetical protein
MWFSEPHPYPERGSLTDGASRGNKEMVIVYTIIRVNVFATGLSFETPGWILSSFVTIYTRESQMKILKVR